jgi:hypothetical protein
MSWWWPFKKKAERKMHNGKCDLCDEHCLVWLDGEGLFCWDHYIERMQQLRDGK